MVALIFFLSRCKWGPGVPASLVFKGKRNAKFYWNGCFCYDEEQLCSFPPPRIVDALPVSERIYPQARTGGNWARDIKD
jgi:hypothetical protein